MEMHLPPSFRARHLQPSVGLGVAIAPPRLSPVIGEPHQAAYFTRSLRIQQETAVLASYFSLEGLVPAEPSAAAAAALADIGRGNGLCTAYETYTVMAPTASISFEYAVFLAECLARGDQLRLGRCGECGGIIVVERFPIRQRRCHHCVLAARP